MAMGEEARALDGNVQLSPTAGPLGQIPAAGRHWEGFGSIFSWNRHAGDHRGNAEGTGVQACAKHYILTEQEHRRQSMSSNADDRTMHERYVWPFADFVRANVALVMCSYSRVNSVYACENDVIMNCLTKEELNFAHFNKKSENTGLDMAMPGDGMGDGYFLWKPESIQSRESASL
ncbi:beta-glucosidase [Blastomyces silverae]|uniref:Probable beta-glucosidase L n=1 Tax=Blastomyces silverae TaxID=2060906 RepID=A0A0H1BBE4_9EURO|nr:beta-glucosidase [Blastomyces silverae]